MATTVPGDGLADTQTGQRAMPPALAAALAKKQKGKGKPAPADTRDAGGPGMDDDMMADGERALPPVVNGKVPELNEYPDYSADADDNSTGVWKKTPDQASGTLPEGSFQRTVRFPDAGPWKQV